MHHQRQIKHINKQINKYGTLSRNRHKSKDKFINQLWSWGRVLRCIHMESCVVYIDNFPTKVRLMNKCHAYSVEATLSYKSNYFDVTSFFVFEKQTNDLFRWQHLVSTCVMFPIKRGDNITKKVRYNCCQRFKHLYSLKLIIILPRPH